MFVAFDTAAGTAIPKPFERELKVLLSPDRHTEVKGFTFVLSTLAPNGGCTDFHCHPESGELMIFLSGTGTAWFHDSVIWLWGLTVWEDMPVYLKTF